MEYSILFGGEAAISFTDADAFKVIVGASRGIQALQRSSSDATVTYRIGDESLPEDIRYDWNKIAQVLTP